MINRPNLSRTARLLPLLGLLGPVRGARAQDFDIVGTRAQGMGGAFVAVADDASATWWNPAGLATGAFLSALVERGQIREPADPPALGPADRNGTSGFAAAFPALGVSFYRLRASATGPADSIAAVEPGRQDQGIANRVIRSAATSAFGVTVGQSIGDHLVIASTIRLVRAGAVVVADAGGSSDPLDRADDLDVPRQTRADLDLGALLQVGAVRIGGAVKHVGEPAFGDGGERLVLERRARIGLALTKGRTGMFGSLTGAVDVDLTSAATALGDQRRLAMGGEAGMLQNRVTVRGGVNVTTTAARTWTPAIGASVALRSGLYIDGAATPGTGASRRGWSLALRASF